MLGKLLVIIVIGLSITGCALLQGRTEPMGITDWVELPIGTEISGVPLPTTEEGKTYTIVVSKPSAMVSLDGLDRMGK